MLTTAFMFGPWLIVAALAIIAFRYYRAAKAGNLKPPVTINPGAALKAIQDALAGNSAAALTALGESFHLDVAAGSIEDKLLRGGFAELERRATDPASKMPVVDYIAHFSGKTREDVIKFLEVEAGVSPPPAATPAVATAALLLCLCLGSSAAADGPNYSLGPTHWNVRVPAPQRFYRTELNLIPADRADCDLPPSQPNVFVRYFYADWCADCKKSTAVADSLIRQGYGVLKENCTKDTGMARVFDVKSVPFWIVHVDGKTTLKTNDTYLVTAELAKYPPKKQPVGYRIGAHFSDGNGNQVTPTQWGQPVYYTAIGIDGINTPQSDALACVNALRANNGLGLLTESASLAAAALNQANWLAYYGYEGHNGDGHTFGNGSSQQRAYAAGFRGTIEAPNPGNTNNFVGECIRCSWNETGAQVIEGWRTSTGGHWKALIAPSFNVCGFGCAKSRQGRDIWVGMFGREERYFTSENE
jgi:uncharacterized protein YkwD